MIGRVRLANFKRFRDQTFELDDATVLAGPNSSGKSTLLQAITLGKDALDLWVAQRYDATRAWLPSSESWAAPSSSHRKADLHLIASVMRPDEIHPEVVEKLDGMAEVLVQRSRGPFA